MCGFIEDGPVSASTEFVIDNFASLLFGVTGNRPGGLVMTLLLATVGLAFGTVVALAIGAVHDSHRRSVRWLANGYVHVIRGVPLVLLFLLIHQSLGTGRILGISTTPVGSAIVGLILYSSAYQADIIKTGLRSVPSGMIEWARLMGASRVQAYRLVKLPYTLRVMLPALTGQGITLFKDTSVVVIIGVADLTTTARIVLGGDVGNAPFWVATYLTVGFLYFAVAFGMSRLALRLERRYVAGNMIHSLATTD